MSDCSECEISGAADWRFLTPALRWPISDGFDVFDYILARDRRDGPVTPNRNQFVTYFPLNVLGLPLPGNMPLDVRLGQFLKCIFIALFFGLLSLLFFDCRVDTLLDKLPPSILFLHNF